MSKPLAKVPNIKDFEIESRLDRLREYNNKNKNEVNNNNNNNSFQLPPQPPPQPPPQFPGFDISPAQTQLPLSHFNDFLLPDVPNERNRRQNNNGGVNLIKNWSGQNWIGQLERVIEKSQKPKEKFEVNNSISDYFNDAEEFLNGRYLEKMENRKKELKEIENKYIFSLIFDQLNEGKTPE